MHGRGVQAQPPAAGSPLESMSASAAQIAMSVQLVAASTNGTREAVSNVAAASQATVANLAVLSTTVKETSREQAELFTTSVKKFTEAMTTAQENTAKAVADASKANIVHAAIVDVKKIVGENDALFSGNIANRPNVATILTVTKKISSIIAPFSGSERRQILNQGIPITQEPDAIGRFTDDKFKLEDGVCLALIEIFALFQIKKFFAHELPPTNGQSLLAAYNNLLVFRHFTNTKEASAVATMLASVVPHGNGHGHGNDNAKLLDDLRDANDFVTLKQIVDKYKFTVLKTPSTKAAKAKQNDAAGHYIVSLLHPQTRAMHAAAPFVLPLTLRDASGGVARVLAAVDTQSGINAISSQAAHRLRLPRRAHRTPLSGATRSLRFEAREVVDIIGIIDNCDVQLSDVSIIAGLHHDVILGVPAIEKLDIISELIDGKPVSRLRSTRAPSSTAAPHGAHAAAALPTPTEIISAITPSPTVLPSFKYGSAVDEIMHNVEWRNLESLPDLGDMVEFKAFVRAQLNRLAERDLLVSKNAPGRKYPQLLHRVEHVIVLKSECDLSRVWRPFKALSAEQQKAVDDYFDELEEAGIVGPAVGASPVQIVPMLVPKLDDSDNVVGWRVVIDARQLNEQSVFFQQQLPLIADVLRRVSETELSSVVDFASYYWQFAVPEQQRHLLRTRVGPNRVVDWRVMPQGLHSAVATAQQYSERHFANNERIVYIDDIFGLHFKKLASDLRRWLKEFVDVLIDCNATINASKTKLFARVNKVLGFEVSKGAINPIESRVQTLIDWPVPASKKELHRFLATANWYSSHIGNLASLAAGLNDMLSTRVPFRWLEQHQRAFEAIKYGLVHRATLSAPRKGATVYLSTDASDAAAGYVAEQLDEAGTPRIIACGGAKFTSTQRRYTIPEKELLALQIAMTKIGVWLSHVTDDVVWRTDSQAAAAFQSTPIDGRSAAIRKFIADLQVRRLKVEHVDAKLNPVSDAISRNEQVRLASQLPALIAMISLANESDAIDDDGDDDNEAEEIVLASGVITPIQGSVSPSPSTPTPPTSSVTSAPTSPSTLQRQRPLPPPPPTTVPSGAPSIQLAPPLSSSSSSSSSASSSSASSSASTSPMDSSNSTTSREPATAVVSDKLDDIDVAGGESQRLASLPSAASRLEALLNSSAHAGYDGAHAGPRSSVYAGRLVGYWPKMHEHIGELASKCIVCQKTRQARANASMGTPDTDIKRNEYVDLDFVPMPTAGELVGFFQLTDAATGFTFAKPVTDRTSKSAQRAVEEYISLLDTPRVVRVDAASETSSEAFRAFLTNEGIELRINSPQNHQALGVGENRVGALKNSLVRLVQGHQERWPEKLLPALRGLNRRVSPVRGFVTPHQLMFGSNAHSAIARRFGVDTVNESPVPADADGKLEFAQALGGRVETAVATAAKHRARSQAANAKRQAARGTRRDVSVGDYVFVTNVDETQASAFLNKQRQSGPYQITEIDVANRRVTLMRPADGTVLRTPVTINRIQLVDSSAVLSPTPVTDEPGVLTWSGVSDPSLLLPTEQNAVAKSIARQDRQRQVNRDPPPAVVDKAAAAVRRRVMQQKAATRRREEQDQRAAAERQRQQVTLDRETRPIPDGAVPIGIIHHVNGTLLTLTTDIFRSPQPGQDDFYYSQTPSICRAREAVSSAST